MPIRTENILSLLKEKLSTLNLDQISTHETSIIEKRIADELLKAIDNFEDQDQAFFEKEEELFETNFKDTDYLPVYEDYFDESTRELFSYEYICKVLDYKDANPNHSMKTISSKSRRVKNLGYITKFRVYRNNLGVRKEKLIKIAKFCKEMFDETRLKGVIIHDRTIRMWALSKARELQLT